MAHPALRTMLRGQIAALAAQPTRPERYFARVDAHTADMDGAAQLAFLRAELEKWQARYQTFQKAVFAGQDLEGDVTAWDYAETIAVLATRIATLERSAVAA